MASSRRYRVEIKRSAAKAIEALDQSDRRRVVERIAALADAPRPPGCVKLAGADLYRIRQGPIRIVYQIEDRRLIVVIVKVAQRRDAYRSH